MSTDRTSDYLPGWRRRIMSPVLCFCAWTWARRGRLALDRGDLVWAAMCAAKVELILEDLQARDEAGPAS